MANVNCDSITRLQYMIAISGLFTLMAGTDRQPLSEVAVNEIVGLKLNAQNPTRVREVQIHVMTDLRHAHLQNQQQPMYAVLNVQSDLADLKTRYNYLDAERNAAVAAVSTYLSLLRTQWDLKIQRILNASPTITYAKLLAQPRAAVVTLLYELFVLIMGQCKYAMVTACGVMYHLNPAEYTAPGQVMSPGSIANAVLSRFGSDTDQRMETLIEIMSNEIMLQNTYVSDSNELFTEMYIAITGQLELASDDRPHRILWSLLFGCPTDVELVAANDANMSQEANRYSMQYAYLQIQQFLLNDTTKGSIMDLKKELIYKLPANTSSAIEKRKTSNIHNIKPFGSDWPISSARMLGVDYINKLVSNNDQILLLGPYINTLTSYTTQRYADWDELRTNLVNYSELVKTNMLVAIDMAFCVGSTIPLNIYLVMHYLTRSYINRTVPLATGDAANQKIMTDIYQGPSVPRIKQFLDVQYAAAPATPALNKRTVYRLKIVANMKSLETLSPAKSVALHAPCPGEMWNGMWRCAYTPLLSYGWGNCRMLSSFGALYHHLSKSSNFKSPLDVVVPGLAATMSPQNVAAYALQRPFNRNDSNQFLTDVTNLMIAVSTTLLYRVLVMNHKCFAANQATPQLCQQATERFLGNMYHNYSYMRQELTLEMDKVANKSMRYWLGDVVALPDGLERYAICLNLYRLINVMLWTAASDQPENTLSFLINPAISDQQQTELFWLSVQSMTITDRPLYDLAHVFNVVYVQLMSPFLRLSKIDQFKTFARQLNGNDPLVDQLEKESGLAKLETQLAKMSKDPAHNNFVPFYYALFPTLISGQLPQSDSSANNDFSHMPLIMNVLKYDAFVAANPNHEIVYGFSTPGHASIIITNPGVNSTTLYHKIVKPYTGLVCHWIKLVLDQNGPGLQEMQNALQGLDEAKLDQFIASGLQEHTDLYGDNFVVPTQNLTGQLVALPENPSHIDLALIRTQLQQHKAEFSQGVGAMTLSTVMTQITDYFAVVFRHNNTGPVTFDGQSFYDLSEVVGQMSQAMDNTRARQVLRFGNASNITSLLNMGNIMVWARALNDSGNTSNPGTIMILSLFYQSIADQFLPQVDQILNGQVLATLDISVKEFVTLLSSLAVIVSFDAFEHSFMHRLVEQIVDTKDHFSACNNVVNSQFINILMAVGKRSIEELLNSKSVKLMLQPSFNLGATMKQAETGADHVAAVYNLLNQRCSLVGVVAKVLSLVNPSHDVSVAYLKSMIYTTEFYQIYPMIPSIVYYQATKTYTLVNTSKTIDFFLNASINLTSAEYADMFPDLYRMRGSDNSRYVAGLQTMFANVPPETIYNLRSTIIMGIFNMACAWNVLDKPVYQKVFVFWKRYFRFYLCVEYALQEYFDVAPSTDTLEQSLVELQVDIAKLRDTLEQKTINFGFLATCALSLPSDLLPRLRLPVYTPTINISGVITPMPQTPRP